MNALDLFSGIGGFSLGLERAGITAVAFCEIEEFPRKVLRKHWPDVPIFEDVRALHAADITSTVDLICGGFPCQPFSLAGKRQGKDDDRHLWPEFFRLVREIRPSWVICENVVGLVSMGLDQVLSDLESERYTARPFIIPACAVNAPHRRDRVWIVANAPCNGRDKRRAKSTRQQRQARVTNGRDDVTDTNSELLNRGGNVRETGRIEFTDGGCSATDSDNQGPQRRRELGEQEERRKAKGGIGHDFAGSYFERITRAEWTTQPPVCSRNDGVSKRLVGRVAKLKALGNAVVPQIPELIGRAIMKIELGKG